MSKWPEVVGLTLCERFEINQGMASLVGLFQGLHFASFPSPVKDLIVYAGLSGKSVEGTMELAVTRLVGEKDLFSYKRWLTFPDQVITVNLLVPVACVFPAPGLYSVSLRFDNEVLSQRTLEIFAD